MQQLLWLVFWKHLRMKTRKIRKPKSLDETRKELITYILQELRLSDKENFRKYLRMNTATYQVNFIVQI